MIMFQVQLAEVFPKKGKRLEIHQLFGEASFRILHFRLLKVIEFLVLFAMFFKKLVCWNVYCIYFFRCLESSQNESENS